MLQFINRVCATVLGAGAGGGIESEALTAHPIVNDTLMAVAATAPPPAPMILFLLGIGLSGLGVLARRLRRK